jgi:hypothetical protein
VAVASLQGLIDLLTGSLWTYPLLGYLGGRIFRDRPILQCWSRSGVAAAITAGVEGWRRFRK